jgi:DNA-binding response OmpR family regulator
MEDKKLVLVIEDDPFYSNIYMMKLKKEGIRAEVALNGDAGLAVARKEKPALILTDLIMPGKDGFEILKELKANPTLRDVPVIVLSNLSQEEDMRRAKELGAVEYLVKANISIQDVIEKVKSNLATV